MKYQSIVCFTKALLVLAGLSACSVALAQSPEKACLGVDAGISFTISFEGPSADRIKDVSIRLAQQGQTTPPDQDGFGTYWGTDKSTKIAPGVFTVSGAVPKTLANGSYTPDLINATTDLGLGITYRPPLFTPPPATEVCNPNHFKNPPIKKVIKNP